MRKHQVDRHLRMSVMWGITRSSSSSSGCSVHEKEITRPRVPTITIDYPAKVQMNNKASQEVILIEEFLGKSSLAREEWLFSCGSMQACEERNAERVVSEAPPLAPQIGGD